MVRARIRTWDLSHSNTQSQSENVKPLHHTDIKDRKFLISYISIGLFMAELIYLVSEHLPDYKQVPSSHTGTVALIALQHPLLMLKVMPFSYF
jgi:hypothetical protein